MSLPVEKFYFTNDRLLKEMSSKDRQQLELGMQEVKLRKGKVLFQEHAFPKGMYILRKGKVKIYQTNKEGREQIMHIYTKGELLGHRPLISQEPYAVSAMTLEACTFHFIPREHFLKTINNSSELTRLLMLSFCREYAIWLNIIKVFAQCPVKARVALILLVLHEKYKVKGKAGEINLSRDDLAGYVGTVKETLVRVLQEFKKKDFIRTQGRKIRVINPVSLGKLADLL